MTCRGAITVISLVLLAGCKTDSLRSKHAIRQRAAWLTMNRYAMRAEAHRRGLGSICVLPVRGETQLVGPWQSPYAQLQIDAAERRSYRTGLTSMYRRFGFAVADRTESELLQIEQRAQNLPGRRLALLGHIGRTVGAEIVLSPSMDVLRESYFVPYVGWKTRGWATLTEQYWDARSDVPIASYAWNGRQRKFHLSGLKESSLFKGFEVVALHTHLQPEDIQRISEYWASVDPAAASWQTNYTLGGWFAAESQGLSSPNGPQLAISHYEHLIQKRPNDAFLKILAELKILEVAGKRTEAGEKSLAAAQLLPQGSSLWLGEVQRASRLLEKPESTIRQMLGLADEKPIAMSSFDAALVKPAVVWVICTRDDADAVSGSGFLVCPGGLILTNAHVVKKAKQVKVKYWDGISGSAEIVAQDDVVDLALLRVARQDLPYLKISDQKRAQQGTT
ncbi:MAG: serine protease, partial [Phycisphaerae bacterium]